jgi:hypothetical protein
MENQNIKPKKSLNNWYVLYLVLLIGGQQLAGIGGAIGGVFIAFGLNKVLRNADYSNGKKVFYSILYSIGGIIMALVIGIALTFVLRYYFPTIGQKSNIESTYQIPSNFTAYKNQDMEISSLAYPTGWTVTEGKKDEYKVLFESPNKISNATVSLLVSEKDKLIDYKTYWAQIAEEFKSQPNIDIQKTSEEIKNINGKEWLIITITLTPKDSDKTYYSKQAVLITGKGDPHQNQYYIFLMESDKEHSAEDFATLDKMIESFRFYK